MIITLRGKLRRRETDWISVEVGGIGYQVFIPLSTYYKLPNQGDDVYLHTTMIVREDMMSLFGFFTPEEKRLFQLLLSVSKVGPKLALNLLSGMEAHELISRIQNEDVLAVKSIPGVGMKTAERIILELKGKVAAEKAMLASATTALDQGKQVLYEDVLSALMALGYRKQESEKAIRKVIAAGTDNLTMEAAIKNSLKILAKRDKK
ncbi:Holliday junction branch migration protein RuvA [candidate division CSSED10-310 bacterium]|uniref:Holliday junction branch migration complex subunit RuvA n=1 Tax=candidate division CSSED10-310 bacterium TaxID=2855610 RepID=A0ABV6Z0F0_UNCC1